MMQRTTNENFLLQSFASLCSTVQYFWGRRSFQIRYAAHFLHGLAMIFPAGQFVSVRSFLIAATTRYSEFFLLSLVTRFACDIGFGFEFHLRSSPSAYSGFCEYQSTSWILDSLLRRAEETQQGRNSCPRLQFGFQLNSIVSLPR